MSSKNNNQLNVPQAKEAMERFKMECANEVGVNLKQGYNGDISAREAGSVGGQMVNNICPVRNFTITRHNRSVYGHSEDFYLDVSVDYFHDIVEKWVI